MYNPDEWLQAKIGDFVEGDNELPDDSMSKPSFARMYDYALGGKDHFKVDRDAYHQISAAYPGGAEAMRSSRACLQRAVYYLAAEAGIHQFIDVGSGLPTQQNVHDIARAVNPRARVVYVDKDPIVLAHGRVLLATNPTTTVIRADAAHPESILNHPDTRRLIDFNQPFAVLMALLLHHLTDEQDPIGVTQKFKDAMPSGSYLFTINMLRDDHPYGTADFENALVSRLGSGYLRPWNYLRRYYDGLDMVEPGLVYTADWKPDIDGDVTRIGGDGEWHTISAAGLGQKP